MRSLGVGLVVALAASWAVSAAEAAPRPLLSAETLLARTVDPEAALAPLPSAFRVVQHSSHDRRGANGDTSTHDPRFGPIALPSYIRQEPGGVVFFDQRRPGCLTRMWFTGLDGTAGATGSLRTLGNRQFFFDDEARPRVDLPANQLFTGSVPGFPYPLVGDAARSSGGNYSYVPMCFARSLKIRATAEAIGLGWYQLEALVAPHGTPVDTSPPPARAVAAAADALAHLGRPPAGAPAFRLDRSLGAGRQATTALSGSGHVRFLRVSMQPFDTATLQSTRLRVTADGARTPQLDLPFGALFGDGLEARRIRSLAFGEDPARHSGYLALPIPFADGLRLDVVAASPVTVSLEGWRSRARPGGPRLFGERRSETAGLGTDYTVLAAEGSGRLVSMVVDIVGHEGSAGAETYLEGDDRVHVDGSRSPSVYGTGTEDNFNGGFYYANGAFSLPTHGAGPLGSQSVERGTRSQYRVFAGDAVLWSNGIRYGMEHGAGNEHVVQVTSTTLSYRAPRSLTPSDQVSIGDPLSERAHAFTGASERRLLSAFFEGDRDGNVPLPGIPASGAPPLVPAQLSPEGLTTAGVAFAGPLTSRLALPPANCGAVVRRLLDAYGPAPSDIDVLVDGRRVGRWMVAETNPMKRWTEDDFEVPAAFTSGRSSITVSLRPRAQPETAFSLQLFSRAGC